MRSGSVFMVMVGIPRMLALCDRGGEAARQKFCHPMERARGARCRARRRFSPLLPATCGAARVTGRFGRHRASHATIWLGPAANSQIYLKSYRKGSSAIVV